MDKQIIKRIYHPYTVWEDHKNGMWRTLGKDEDYNDLLRKAITFTGNAELYGSFMMRVVSEWPRCSEHNITDLNINRKAWVGHAACCMALNCPEDITRQAWKYLTQDQRNRANAKAENAIRSWEASKIRKTSKQMEFCFGL